jgi:hypothetical protein
MSVIIQFLKAASMKFRVFWDVAPRGNVEVDRRLRGSYCLHHYHPDEGGSTHLRNVSQLQRDLYQKTLNYNYVCLNTNSYNNFVLSHRCFHQIRSETTLQIFDILPLMGDRPM